MENNQPKEYTRKNQESGMLLEVKAVALEDEEYVINFIGSSETKDRYGDIVKSDSWLLDNYKKNPVFLWGHNHRELPVGKALDVKVNSEAKQLEFKIKFAVEEYDFAATVYKLYKGGYLKATSVGFIPNAFDYDEEKDAFLLSDNELLELSAVTVPANPDALAMGYRKGMLDHRDIVEMEKYGMIKDAAKFEENEKEGSDPDSTEHKEEEETVEKPIEKETEVETPPADNTEETGDEVETKSDEEEEIVTETEDKSVEEEDFVRTNHFDKSISRLEQKIDNLLDIISALETKTEDDPEVDVSDKGSDEPTNEPEQEDVKNVDGEEKAEEVTEPTDKAITLQDIYNIIVNGSK